MVSRFPKHSPKLFFVGYGGGHIKIIDLVAKNLIGRNEYDFNVLALTSAWPAIKQSYPAGVVRCISDYIDLFSDELEEILGYGVRLLDENFTPGTGITKLESVIYLGLSFWDLVQRFGYDHAAELYRERRRHAFLPLTVMERILRHVQPKVVVATTSPKCEQAALCVGNELGIETVQICDLFAEIYPKPSARHIVCLNESVAEDFRLDPELRDRSYHPLGQPVFDQTVVAVQAIDRDLLRHRLKISAEKKVIMFASHQPTILGADLQIRGVADYSVYRPVFQILRQLQSEMEVVVLLRIHPNETPSCYEKLTTEFGIPIINSTLNLHESIAIADVVLSPSSTVAVEALLCAKPSLTFMREDEDFYPLPRAMKEPFVFSKGWSQLEQNLIETLNSPRTAGVNSFYHPNSAETIADLLLELSDRH